MKTQILNIHKTAFLLLLTLCLMNYSLSAQSLKYDDLHKELPSLKPSQGLYKLLKFQKQDPYFVNTYMQIGNLCEKQIKTTDPLRELDYSLFWAENASLYYGIYPKFTKKGEANRNKEYYFNLNIPYTSSKLTDDEVLSYVNTRLKHYDEYKKNVTLIYTALEKSKELYSNSIQMFTEINNQYENMNDLLLHTDEEVLYFIDSLNTQFSNFRISFVRYKELLSQFPIANYHQEYTLKNIETYRLDGLTSSDFLNNEFIVWDYDFWISNFNTTYTNDILTLRQQIGDIQTSFNNNKTTLDQLDTIAIDSKFSSYDKLFFFRLGHYDNYSVVKDLFKYLDLRQRFFVYGNSPISCPSDTAIILMNTKLRFYSNLSVKHEENLKELAVFKKSISKEKVGRFKQFFEEYYDGSEGLLDFAQSEKEVLYNNMKNDFSKLKSYYINQDSTKNRILYAAYKKDSIATFTNNYVLDSNDVPCKYATTHIEYSKGKPAYVAGNFEYRKSSKSFLAKLNQQDSVVWFYDSFTANNKKAECIKATYAYSTGCAVITTSPSNDTLITLLNFDQSGKKILEKTINDSLSPCMVKYNEIEQRYLMVFGMNTLPNDTGLIDSLCTEKPFDQFKICYADSMGNEIWNTIINTKGEIVDVVKTGNNYQVYINTQTTNNTDSVENWELTIHQLDNLGQLEKTIPIKSNASFSIQQTYHISDASVNLVGFFGKNPKDWSGDLVYLVVSDQGEITYSNLPY